MSTIEADVEVKVDSEVETDVEEDVSYYKVNSNKIWFIYDLKVETQLNLVLEWFLLA